MIARLSRRHRHGLARTLVVLDVVDEWKYKFDVKNTHTNLLEETVGAHCRTRRSGLSLDWLVGYDWLRVGVRCRS